MKKQSAIYTMNSKTAASIKINDKFQRPFQKTVLSLLEAGVPGGLNGFLGCFKFLPDVTIGNAVDTGKQHKHKHHVLFFMAIAFKSIID